MRIAGTLQRPGLRQEGYVAWVNREAKRLGVHQDVDWLGPLPANRIVAELQRCAAVIVPTFVEGYCLALAEAMAIGAPAAVAYVGGAAHLAVDEASALYFSPGDAEMAAFQVSRILTDQALASRLSREARKTALARHEQARITGRQMEIYRNILEGCSNEGTERMGGEK
jgi:glycosyltransferase involved in cell wall biosynthesis